MIQNEDFLVRVPCNRLGIEDFDEEGKLMLEG
jgi:hypothetical protein